MTNAAKPDGERSLAANSPEPLDKRSADNTETGVDDESVLLVAELLWTAPSFSIELDDPLAVAARRL
jgi:hypothetical protein